MRPFERPADQVISRYLTRMPGADYANHNDPTYHAQISFMRNVFTTVDMAMEDEGIDEPTRLRVLRAAMYGAPDLDEPMERIAEQRVRMETMMAAPPDWLAMMESSGLWPSLGERP